MIKADPPIISPIPANLCIFFVECIMSDTSVFFEDEIKYAKKVRVTPSAIEYDTKAEIPVTKSPVAIGIKIITNIRGKRHPIISKP